MLSGNTLKIIAAVSMLIDHTGAILFPEMRILRILGRIAFPIFSYMISEGCIYTRNKGRYLGTIFAMAVIYQLVYFGFTQDMYLSILFTFSFAIVVIYALLNFKKKKNTLSFLAFVLSVAAVYVINEKFTVDYGFWGCMTPVFATLFEKDKQKGHTLPVLSMTVCLIILAHLSASPNQIYSLMSVPLLLMYSGKRGKYNMKYFFYIFYPVHLIVLQIIDIIA